MTRPTSATIAFLLALQPASACLPSAAPGEVDSGPPSVRIEVVDALGTAQDVRASGRRPRFRFHGVVVAVDDLASVLLVPGEPDEALLEDARRRPLTSTSRSRSLPSRVSASDEGFELEPSGPLSPRDRVSLVVPSFLFGSSDVAPLVATLEVAATESGAVLVESFPPDGTIGLSTSIPSIDLGFDDVVEHLGTITLVDDTGALVSTETSPLDCASAGLLATTCARIRVTTGLRVDARHSVDCRGLRDRHGDAICESPVTFVTTSDPVVSVPLAIPCAIDERTTSFGCVLEQDARITVRVRVTSLARLTLGLASRSQVAISRSGDAVLVATGLEHDAAYPGTLTIEDAVGERTTFTFDVRTAPRFPAVVIGEIRADAHGPEPAQEYVELWNLDDVAIDLGGFRLADASDREGDLLPSPLFLPRNGVVLVVADAFDPSNPLDVAPPPGALLARIGASLCSSGLTNSGEPLFLRDPSGHRVAEAPSVASPRAGACVVRAPDAVGAAPIASYVPSSSGCSPGVR